MACLPPYSQFVEGFSSLYLRLGLKTAFPINNFYPADLHVIYERQCPGAKSHKLSAYCFAPIEGAGKPTYVFRAF